MEGQGRAPKARSSTRGCWDGARDTKALGATGSYPWCLLERSRAPHVWAWCSAENSTVVHHGKKRGFHGDVGATRKPVLPPKVGAH